MSPIYGYVTKLFLESEFQNKGINKRKKLNSQQNLAFSWQEQIQKIILLNTTQKGQKKIFGQNCHH